MNPIKLLLAVVLMAVPSTLIAATNVSSDITSDTTWNAAGSPYTITTDEIEIKSGATLTIDTSLGAVEVKFQNSTDDFRIGTSAGGTGFLVINAATNNLTFRLKKQNNISIEQNGQIRHTASTGAVIVENHGTSPDSVHDWGALNFNGGSYTYQSHLVNWQISGGGYDGHQGAIHVHDTPSNPPIFENISFDSCNVSAFRFDGKGVDTLRQGGIVLPLSVTNTDYVFWLNGVTSTKNLHFPDTASPDSPEVKISGTCTVGDSTNVSHWRFDDGYTFECAASSLVTITRGSIWGSIESRPVFRSISGSPTYADWVGLRDTGTTYDNIFGGIGPFAFVTVRDATYGVDLDKYAVSSPIAGKTLRLPGVYAYHCTNGVRLKGPMTGTIVLEDANLGHESSSAEYNSSRCVEITAGDVHLEKCDLRGVTASGGTRVVSIGGGSLQYELRMNECRFGGQGSYAVYLGEAVTAGNATIERCSIEGTFGSNTILLTATANVARSLTIRHTLLGGFSCLSLSETGGSTPTISVLVEDTTFVGDNAGTSYGLYGADVPASPSSVLCRRCTFLGRTYGAFVVNDSTNLCEYTFDECWFNGNANGIYDDRNYTAKCVAIHCGFEENSSYAAFDSNGSGTTTDMLAKFCWWNSPTGPAEGPGWDDVGAGDNGDNVNWGSVGGEYLNSPYFGAMVGGSPAAPTNLGVKNAIGGTTYPDQLHIIDDDAIAVAWQFASDFEGQSQSAYQIEIDNNSDFGSLTYTGSKVPSSSADIAITPTLAAGTIYYVRVRLWDASDRAGPWYYHTFRTNSPPPAPGMTSRTPGTDNPTYPEHQDHTPAYQWQRPTDSDKDPLHFVVEVDDTVEAGDTFNKPTEFSSLTSPGLFEVSTDSGATWFPFPSDGAPQGEATLVRIITPNANFLANGTWFWRIKAYDGFEFGGYSAIWGFAVVRKYTISGQLTDPAGLLSGIAGQPIKVAKSGVVLSAGATTDGSGNFSLADMTDDLRAGDILVVFVNNNGGTDTATLVQFAGDDMTAASGRFAKVNLELGRAVLETRFPTPLSNSDFATDDAADSDIPWSEAGTVTFDAGTSGSNQGVRVKGEWRLDSTVTGSAAAVELHVEASGELVTDGYNATFKNLSNKGRVCIRQGSVFTLDGGSSTSESVLELEASTLKFNGSAGLSLTVSSGIFDARQGATIEDASAGNFTSRIVVDSSSATMQATLSSTNTTWKRVALIVEDGGAVNAFNDNNFADTGSTSTSGTATAASNQTLTDSGAGWSVNAYAGLVVRLGSGAGSYKFYEILSNTSTTITIPAEYDLDADGWGGGSAYAVLAAVPARWIHWKCTEALGSVCFSRIQFNNTLGGHNVEAPDGVVTLTMMASVGTTTGASWELDPYAKVVWGLSPVIDVSAVGGDTRAKVTWNASFQLVESPKGYNVYASRVLDGGRWTADPAYFFGSDTTSFVDANARFTLTVSVGDEFHPKFSSNAKLTVSGVISDTEIRVSGDHTADAAEFDSYSFFTKRNSSLLSGATASEVVGSLTNDKLHYFYVTIDDSTEDTPALRFRSATALVSTSDTNIVELAPNAGAKSSNVAVTVIGKGTHWKDASGTGTLSYTGTNVTINDTIYISATLALTDLTLASNATSGNIQVIRNDVWGVAAYDESESSAFTVNNTSDLTRPTISFSAPSADANVSTAGTWTITLAYNAQGGTISTSTLELMASRAVTIQNSSRPAGTNLSAISNFWDATYPNPTTATCTVNNTSATELFSDGEYILSARIANNNGLYSEWQTRRFFVNGAGTNVAKCTTLLIQGTTMNATVTGTSLSSTQTISFGSDITVNSASGSGSSITVNVTVGHLAACGPRTITTNNGSKSGIATVEYPTNVLPTTTNAEPSRNPAIGGVNVFLKNGAFFKSETDIAVRGRMMGISWSRFYRSDIGYNGPLGNGWVGHYFQRAKIDGSNDINWYTPDGRTEVFPDVTGGYSSPAGVYVTATSEATHNTITLTDRHGYRCIFNKDGRLWRCIDRNGNKTECAYNFAGQLTTIANDLGETFTIAYHTHGRVDTVSDNMWNDGTDDGYVDHSVARQIEYEYSSAGDLTEQKAPTTQRYDGTPLARTTYGYAYDAAHRILRCINPREFAQGANPVAYLENTYDSTGRVTDQKLGDEADVLDHHIAKSAFIRLRYESSTVIHEVDRNGHYTKYTINASGLATTVARYTGFHSADTDYPYSSTITLVLAKLRGVADPDHFDTTFTYNSNHEILTITYPQGNKVTYAYPSGSSQTSATADSCSGPVLTDSVHAGTWTTDQFAGMTLRMGTNQGNYRYYPIINNTNTNITVAGGYSLSDDGWGASAYTVYNQSVDAMAAGNVLTVTRSDEALGSLADIVTTYTYEPRFQFVKTVKDPLTRITTYTYDYEESFGNGADAGNLVLVTSPTVTGSMVTSAAITSRTTYNQYGQPVTMTDGEGNVTYLKYYTSGSRTGFLHQRITAWGALDITSEYDYDAVGNLTASWPPRAFEAGATKDNFKTSYVVNELNQTEHVTGQKFSSTQTATLDTYRYFDANGNLTNVFREYVTWDNNGKTNPTFSQDDDPAWFASEKSANAMAATWVESSFTYNLLNYQKERKQDAVAGSDVTQFTSRTEYDSNYNVLASISPLGNRSHTVYDERDMVYQRIAGAESDVAATYTTNYDKNGNVSTSIDARGNTTTFTYDGFDRITKVKDAANHYRTSEYDANSNVVISKAYNSLNILLAQGTTTYDEINRAYISARLANDHNGLPIGDGYNTSTTKFDLNSRVVSSTNDNGVTYTSFYDAANRTTHTRDAVGNETHYTYNLNGATERVTYFEVNGVDGTVGKSHLEYIRDYADRVTEFRDRRWGHDFDTSGETTYDSWGRVVKSEDAGGNVNTANFDLLGRTFEAREEAGASDINTIFTYDDDGRTIMRGIEHSTGSSTFQETTYDYDERSRLITLRRPDGDIWTFTYDVNGNRTGWQDPLGTTVTDTYDVRNLISYRNIVRGTGIVGTDYESYEFDGLGRLQSCSNYADGELITASAWHYNTQSQPETHDQTIADYQGNIIDTWTTGAEYDATGFNTATIYSNGRRVSHGKDQLDRLAFSYDETNNFEIAAYVYRGPGSIVERTYGNGTRTSYEYEASGCGCGGSTPYITRVEHTEISTGRVLWATDRRYDERGLVTAERRDHEGHSGVVYRYDNAERLEDTYYGVDMSGANLDYWGDPTNDPGTYGKRTQYGLDVRSNRTSVKEYDDGLPLPTEIYDYSYTPDTNTNQYTTVDGSNYTFDAIEQMTFDPTRDLTFAYDYKGQLITEEADGDNPERRYSYDNQGRRRTEASYYEASYHLATLTTFCYPPNCMSCNGGCGGNAGPQSLEDHTYDGGMGLMFSVYPVFGLGAVGGLSGSAKHPATPAFPVGGHFNGPVRIAEWVDYATGTDEYKFRYEDQLVNLLGMASQAAEKLADYVYLDYGHPVERIIEFDGNPGLVYDLAVEAGATIIYLTSSLLVDDSLIGMQLAVADPVNGMFYVGTVLDNDGEKIIVDDVLEDIHDAINEGLSFVVYDFVDTNVATGGTYHTAGIWTSAPSYDDELDVTTFTDSGADFDSHTVGWLVSLNVPEFSYVEIIARTSTTITVKGDARGLGADDGRYWLFAPAHVDPSTGTMAGSYTGSTFEPEYHTSYLWGLYRYQPPMVGFYVDPGTPGVYGRQSGTNQAGWHHAGAREYDPSTGRWTTMDPVMTPWTNCFSYVASNPASSLDPSGLFSIRIRDFFTGKDAKTEDDEDAIELLKKLGEALDKLGGDEPDVIDDADADEVEEAFEDATDDDGVTIVSGHGDKTGVKACAATGEGAAVGAAIGGIIGGIIGFGGGALPGAAVGAAAGAILADDGELKGEDFDEAVKNAKGIVIFFSCNGAALADKFPKDTCVIGYKNCTRIKSKMYVDMKNMADVIGSIKKGECMSWQEIVNKTNAKDKGAKALSGSEEQLTCSGDKKTGPCATKKVCN